MPKCRQGKNAFLKNAHFPFWEIRIEWAEENLTNADCRLSTADCRFRGSDPKSQTLKSANQQSEICNCHSQLEARRSYSCSIPRCATPILSRVEFFTIYIIPSACRITSCAERASCGYVATPIDARTFRFNPSSRQNALARSASRNRFATTSA